MPCKINTGDSSENTQLFTQSRRSGHHHLRLAGTPGRQAGRWEASRWKGKAWGALMEAAGQQPPLLPAPLGHRDWISGVPREGLRPLAGPTSTLPAPPHFPLQANHQRSLPSPWPLGCRGEGGASGLLPPRALSPPSFSRAGVSPQGAVQGVAVLLASSVPSLPPRTLGLGVWRGCRDIRLPLGPLGR